MRLQNLLRLRLWLLWLPYFVAAYDPPPRLVTVHLFIFSSLFTLYRWAHSAVLVNDALYVYGGKIDQSNQFSYTSAPDTNELLYLSLSTTFSVQSPSWQLLDSSQGPAIAWHTLAAINNSQVLLFGGQPDPNSPTVLFNRTDSAWILDVSSRTSPAWIQEPEGWAGQPVRRIRHSTATAPNGLVFIFGGERADNSHIAFSDHCYFDPGSMTFKSLSTTNAPPDLYGHVSIILPDGRILVFGGCTSQATLLPFSTIWVLNVSNMQWTVNTTDTSALPSPRIAFAATYIGGGLILIHGGSGADLQSCFMDGWILDTTRWTWTRVDALSQIGAKRDHFAVTIGGQVIFGFGKHRRLFIFLKRSALIVVAGYSDNGPAPSTIQVYDPSSNTFDIVYNPPTSTVTTMGSTTSRSATGTPSPSTSPIPTTLDPSHSNRHGNRTAIIVGTVFGVLGLILIGLGTAYYIHRRLEAERADRDFMVLNDEDGDNPSPRHIPAVRMHADIPRHGILSSLGPLSAALKMRSGRGAAPRRDMLADEDERSFGDWYNERRGDGMAGSSWSLRSILGAGVIRREPSVGSHGSAPWREKLDPFSDGPTLMRDEERRLIDGATTSRGSRQVNRSSHSYRDPFADPIHEERESFDSTDLYRDYGRGEGLGQPPTSSSIRLVPNVLPLETVLPITRGGHPLSPVSEQTSQGTVARRSDSSHGQSANEIALDSSSSGRPRSTSVNSAVNAALAPSSRTLSPKTSSVSGTSSPSLMNSTQPMKRSNSWWLRFAPTGLLDRRSSGASRRMEFRDPNPPPRLSAIEERNSYAEKTLPPGSGATGEMQLMQKSLVSPPSSSQQARRLQDEVDVSTSSRGVPMKLYGVDRHGKSVSSLKTVDSEAIERMAGTMDIVQRITTRSHRGTGSIGSIGGLSLDTHASTHIWEREDRISEADDSQNRTERNLIMFTSPVEMERSVPTSPQLLDHEPAAVGTTLRSDLTLSPPISTAPHPSSSNVSQRVRTFDRRMSMEAPVSPPPTNTRHREERTKKVVEVNYGLARRPDLFITNPDRTSESGDL